MRRVLFLCVVVVVGMAAFGGVGSVSASAPSLTVGGRIMEVKAEGGRAVLLVQPPRVKGVLTPGTHCAREVFVWDSATGKVVHWWTRPEDYGGCATGGSEYGLALASDRVAWVQSSMGNDLWTEVHLMSLATGRNRLVKFAVAGDVESGYFVGNTQGHGSLLVYNGYGRCRPITDPSFTPQIPCPVGYRSGAVINDSIRMLAPGMRSIATSERALTVLAVGGGRVVARRDSGGLIVLAPKSTPAPLTDHAGYRAERLIATYPYKPSEVRAAATDGRTLAVLRAGALDVIPLPGSPGRPTTRTLPHAASYGPDGLGPYSPVWCLIDRVVCKARAQLRLTDLDGNIAVYIRTKAVYLLDLTTGRSTVVARPASGPVNAQLEPDGLYITAGNTLTFTPRSQVEQRLHR